MELTPATTLRIEGWEDAMGPNGVPKTEPVAFSVTFSLGDNGVPADVIKIAKATR